MSFTFQPSNGEVVLSAYARCNKRRPELIAEHMVDARNEINYLLTEWSNRQVNLFNVDLQTVALTAGTTTYNVDPSTVMILDAYISFADNTTSDRLIFPISRTEYASYPNKTQQGVPSVFWFDRLIAPTITLWSVPDQTSAYTLNYYRVTQNQDANLPSGATPVIPYRWFDAFVAGLAARLAEIYAPEKADRLDVKAERAFNFAATQDVENVGLYISPGLSGYFSQ